MAGNVGGPRLSPVAIVGALVTLCLFALAAVLFVTGNDSSQRLGLLFALFGTVIAALIGALRSDQAQTGTNGGLDARIESAVFRANAAQRSADGVSAGERAARVERFARHKKL